MELHKVKITNLFGFHHVQKAKADPKRYLMDACSLVQRQGFPLTFKKNREICSWGRQVTLCSPFNQHSKAVRLEGI